MEDIAKKHGCNLLSYEDDNQLCVHCLHNDAAMVAKQLKQGVSAISDSIESSRLKLNPTITELLWFSMTQTQKVQQGFHK